MKGNGLVLELTISLGRLMQVQSQLNVVLPIIAPMNVYLLNPWCRVFLEKLTGLQLVKKLPAFHGTRGFINALTSFSHLSLSWASLIQSIYPHHTSWRSILILSNHLNLGLPSGSFPPVSPQQEPIHSHAERLTEINKL